MGDGRGGFVAAGIFGLVVISASAGSYLTLNMGNGTDYPRYIDAVGDNAATQPPAVTKSVQRYPCAAMANREESDLCAQWRAATAAEHGAFWGFAQMVLSGAGLIGLFVTLWFNRRALEIAERGNLGTRKIGEAQVRSYLSIESAKVQITEHGIAVVAFKVNNAGQSPAIGVEAQVKVRIRALADEMENKLSSKSPGSVIVASQSSIKYKNQTCDVGIANALLEVIDKDDKRWVAIWVTIDITYKDVFKNKYKTGRTFTAARPVWGRGQFYKLPRAQETRAMLLGEVARRKHVGTWKKADGDGTSDASGA